MSKRVEEYIKSYTRRWSNETISGEFVHWLTPYDAEQVAQIARQELIEKIERIIKERKEYHVNSDRWYINYDVLVNGIKKLKN